MDSNLDIESPVISWSKCDYNIIFDTNKYNYFAIKDEFREISKLLSSKLGKPESMCILSGSVVGVTNWESININDQYTALLQSAGVFEASAMDYIRIKGKDAEKILDFLTPKDISKVKIGFATFVIFTTKNATVDDEGVLLRLADDEFLVSPQKVVVV